TNFHKECSISKSFEISNNRYKISIGATHSRDEDTIHNIKEQNQLLLEKAKSITNLNDIDIVKEYYGARACSIDYFPFIGEIIDSTETLKEFPHLKNGTYVNPNRFSRFDNLYILNGVGGRGFVLAPYLSNILVEYLCNDKDIDDNIKIDRLFIRDVKKNK
ncbi:MAG: D-amino-acid oxidase, partial [Campylobacterota bacterium]|nr:D-amino-acid oxidase [Campylobacterota bacterium]